MEEDYESASDFFGGDRFPGGVYLGTPTEVNRMVLIYASRRLGFVYFGSMCRLPGILAFVRIQSPMPTLGYKPRQTQVCWFSSLILRGLDTCKTCLPGAVDLQAVSALHS